MVPRDDWMKERIHSQRNRLMKQPPGPLPIQGSMESAKNPEEVNIIEALKPTDCKKVVIEEVARLSNHIY